MSRNLIDTEARDVTLRKIHLNDVVNTDGGPMVRARILLYMDLARDEAGRLPYGQACLGLLDEGLAVRGASSDGLEVPKLDLKLTYGAAYYQLRSPWSTSVELDEAAIHGAPRFKVVEGRASLQWWVEATVPTSSLEALGAMLHAEGVVMDAQGLQAELTLHVAA